MRDGYEGLGACDCEHRHGVGVKNGVKGGSEAVCYLSVIRRDRRVNPFPSLSYFTVSVL